MYVFLYRCNEETGEVIRVNGRCIKCKPGEPGVFIGKIDPKSPILTYSGYVDEVSKNFYINYVVIYKKLILL